MFFSACQSSGPLNARRPDGGMTELIWLVRSNQAEQDWQTNIVIPGFEDSHPNIRINLIVAPRAAYDQKFDELLNAGTPADIWSHWGTAGFRDYANRGLAADLSPWIDRDNFDLSAFDAAALSAFSRNGRPLGLPMHVTGSFVFYNKNMFDQAGLGYPPSDWEDRTWTWNAFLEKCRALSIITGNPETNVYGCHMGLVPNEAYPLLWGHDIYPESVYETGFAEEAFLDAPAAVAAFQARQDLVWKYRYAPNPAQLQALGENLFQNQRVAMYLAGGWEFRNYAGITDFEWGVAALPFGADNRRGILFSDAWMMNSESAQPEAAWAFLRYLVSPEVQRSWMEVIGLPSAQATLAEDWYSRFPGISSDDLRIVHQGALKHGRAYPGDQLVDYMRIDPVIIRGLNPLLNNEDLPANVLPAANQHLIDVLGQILAEQQ
jgi:multiple sugar transport system substrate-binding protein